VAVYAKGNSDGAIYILSIINVDLQLQRISGCVDSHITNMTSGCTTTGGDVITLMGNSFGTTSGMQAEHELVRCQVK